MSKELDIRLSICPDCGSDDLQLYAMGEHLKPTHSVCNNCEREEKISSLEKENAILESALDDIMQINGHISHDIAQEALDKIKTYKHDN